MKPDSTSDFPDLGPHVSFHPKMVYLGLAMLVLLAANAFLAREKNRLQGELTAKEDQIRNLQHELEKFHSSSP